MNVVAVAGDLLSLIPVYLAQRLAGGGGSARDRGAVGVRTVEVPGE